MVMASLAHCLTDMHSSLLAYLQNSVFKSKMSAPSEILICPARSSSCDVVLANEMKIKVYWEPLGHLCFSWCEGASADAQSLPSCLVQEETDAVASGNYQKQTDKHSVMAGIAKRWKESESLMTSLRTYIYTRNSLHQVFLISENKKHLLA